MSDHNRNYAIERSFVPREKMKSLPPEVTALFPKANRSEIASSVYFSALTESARNADRAFNLKRFLLPFSEVRDPSFTDQVRSKANSKLSGFLQNVKLPGLLSLVTYILDNSNDWVLNPVDRRMWIRHMFVLAIRESDGRENAINSNGAYGLLQHLKSNWNYHAQSFKDSKYCRALRRRGVFTKLAALVRVSESELVQPFGYNNPDSMPVMQVGPMLAQISMLKAYVDKCFVFSELGWKPNPRYQTPLCEEIFSTYKSVLRHRYAGRQLLVSLGHVSGTKWMFGKKVYHPSAYSEDISIFAATLEDPGVDGLINKIIRYWAPIFNDPLKAKNIGDPLDDVRIGGKRKDIKYLASDVPTITPSSTKVKILSHFNPERKKIKTKGGQHTHKGHFGLDIDVYYKPVKAMSDSVVVTTGYEPSLTDGRGRYIILKSTDPISLNWTSRYVHLNKVNVKIGQKVKKGDIIGESGDTGASKSPHLHLEIIDPKGIHRNPLSLSVPLSYLNAI